MMEKIRVLVVDDSQLMHRVMTNLLKDTIFEICCFAESGWEALEKYRLCRPDVVTMDMNLPDMDGLNCSEAILRLDPTANIVMISSMKDAGLAARGYGIGLKGFLQKPLDGYELTETLRRIFSDESREDQEGRETKDDWQSVYLSHFVTALQQNLKRLAGLESSVTVADNKSNRIAATGIVVLVGIAGSQSGRIAFSVRFTTAVQFARQVLGAEKETDMETVGVFAEFANIVSGQAVSAINDIFLGAELRVTPAHIVCGESLSIINPRMDSHKVTAETEHGVFQMDVGLTGES